MTSTMERRGEARRLKLQFVDGHLIVDGAIVCSLNLPLYIEISGDVALLQIEECQRLIITGNVTGDISIGSGSVNCGNVFGSITAMTGSIACGAVTGNVTTTTGEIDQAFLRQC